MGWARPAETRLRTTGCWISAIAVLDDGKGGVLLRDGSQFLGGVGSAIVEGCRCRSSGETDVHQTLVIGCDGREDVKIEQSSQGLRG